MKVLLTSSKQYKICANFQRTPSSRNRQMLNKWWENWNSINFSWSSKRCCFWGERKTFHILFLHTVQPHAPVLIKDSCTINWKITRSNNLPLIVCILSFDLLLENGVCLENLLLFLCCLTEWHEFFSTLCGFWPDFRTLAVNTVSHKNKKIPPPPPPVWKILAHPTLAHHKIRTFNKTRVTKGRNRDTKGSGVLAPEMKG